MLQYTNVTKKFGENRAVDEVSLEIPAGQMVGIIGASGAGKSTLLRMTNRLTNTSEGRIRFNDKDVSSLKGSALREWQRSCAMIFQQFNLVPRLDVLMNVLLGRLNHRPTLSSILGLFTERERAMAISALERLGIERTAMQRAESLSGGQQQRVAIARALMQEPQMILADEPIASLDPRNAQIVMESLKDINENEGITIITNLHTLDTARAFCERIIGMHAGRVVFDGTPEELTEAAAREIYGADGLEDAFSEAITSTSLPGGSANTKLPKFAEIKKPAAKPAPALASVQ